MIYLDNSATTRPFEAVAETIKQASLEDFYNPSAPYGRAAAVEEKVEAARARTARPIGCEPGRIVFTSGGTESNNAALLGVALKRHPAKKHFVVGGIEHPSVLRTVQFLTNLGCTVTAVDPNGKGVIEPEKAAEAVTEDTVLVSVQHVNNETGAIQDLAAIAAAVRAKSPALIHADGVQAYLKVPLSLDAVDFYTVSAHKFHGPKGVGALYLRRDASVVPYLMGGGQEGGRRSGTLNVPGIVGMGLAAELYQTNRKEYVNHMMALKLLFLKELRNQLDEVYVNGPDPERAAPHILNLAFPGVRAEVLLHFLEERGVIIGTGSACSSKNTKVSAVLSAMKVARVRAEGSVRVSLCPLLTEADMKEAAGHMAEGVKMLRRFRRK
ncbi:cysteine desulfurase family protein [Gehongia tenuis]|uniref:Cysteine desulfurase n=1 Tax=Gehongia tenuis TaxID=2763655 RepID=A0A926D1H4_9FIRM|nr:cysteine desulfurase family protein [Gehongia tenuis]MBC8530650.1 cysteine desulfurase [Gehongia tenuis]